MPMAYHCAECGVGEQISNSARESSCVRRAVRDDSCLYQQQQQRTQPHKPHRGTPVAYSSHFSASR